MAVLRPAAVAGRWYPDSSVLLAAEVDDYLARAPVEPLPRGARALVAPHAGLMYSGPVAAFAYNVVRNEQYSAVVLVGPSHFVPFQGVSVWAGGAWETPFGQVAVDSDLAAAIRLESRGVVVELAAAHAREHSLEMQLPFIAHLLPGVPIVPLAMGHQTRATAFALGDAIGRALREWPPSSSAPPPARTGEARHASIRGPRRDRVGAGHGEVLLVASSDLSHYEDAATATALDAVVIRHVDDVNPDALMTAIEREPRHACGGGPMVAVLRAARQLGASRATVLRYADSGDVSGDKSSVVGYMAAAIW
jgi:MEMO1 family protein